MPKPLVDPRRSYIRVETLGNEVRLVFVTAGEDEADEVARDLLKQIRRGSLTLQLAEDE